jgi:hypothetical protein
MTVTEFQQEGAALSSEVLDLKKEIDAKKGQKDQSQRTKVLKCVTSYNKRLVQLAIGRWRDKIQDINIKEDGANSIIRRLRLRFCRKAFDLYVAGVRYQKKLEIEE